MSRPRETPVPQTMQALVVVEPNRMEIREVPVPEPGPNEVLARVAKPWYDKIGGRSAVQVVG